MNPGIWLFTFASMIVLDIAWALYNRHTAHGRKLAAAFLAMALPVLGAVNAIAAVDDPWYLTATALGAFVGTWIGVMISHKRSRSSVTPAGATRTEALELAHLDVRSEVLRARGKFAPFNSAHEGFAVALEEVDELWDHVKMRADRRDLDAMRGEAIQAAAMLTAFAAECCGEKTGRR